MEISEKNPTNQGTFHWLGRDFPELPHVVAAAAAAVTQDGQAGHQVRKHMQYMKYIYIYIYMWSAPPPRPTVLIFNGRYIYIYLFSNVLQIILEIKDNNDMYISLYIYICMNMYL